MLFKFNLFQLARNLFVIHRSLRPDYITITIHSDVLPNVIHTTALTVLCQHSAVHCWQSLNSFVLFFCFFEGLPYQLLGGNNFKELIFVVGWLQYDYAIYIISEA